MNDHDRQAFRVDQIDHVELFVPDRRQAAAWYERVLGLVICPEFEYWADDPRGPLMISSDGGSTKLALFEGRPQGERKTAGYHLVAFRVAGLDFMGFLDRLDELTLTDHRGRTVGPTSAVDHGKAFSLYFNDPYGHRLELTTYEVDGLALPLPVEASVEDHVTDLEIEAAEASDDDGPAIESDGSTDQAPWMCHRCSTQIPAEGGVVCSSCYRSTCRDCVSAATSNDPVCLSCAGSSGT